MTNVIEESMPDPIKPKDGESADVGVKRSLEEMEGTPKEPNPMPSPSRPRLNINKSDKGQIGSHRSRDSKETRCKLTLSPINLVC